MDWCDCLRPSLFGIYCLVKVILLPSHQCIMDIKGEKNYLIRKSIVEKELLPKDCIWEISPIKLHLHQDCMQITTFWTLYLMQWLHEIWGSWKAVSLFCMWERCTYMELILTIIPSPPSTSESSLLVSRYLYSPLPVGSEVNCMISGQWYISKHDASRSSFRVYLLKFTLL